MAGTPTLGVDAFEMGFDFYDDHCGALEMATEDLPAGLVERFSDCSDLDEFYRRADVLHPDADDPDDRVSDADRDILDDLTDRYFACRQGSCYCPADAWETDREYFDDRLGELNAPEWAVTVGDTAVASGTRGELTVSSLFGLLELPREGWSRVTITWDGKDTLEATFGSDRGGSWRPVKLQALSDLQTIASGLVSYENAEPSAAHVALGWDDQLLTVALPFYDRDIRDYGEDDDYDIAEAVSALRLAGYDELSPAAQEVAAGLAVDWDGGIAELLSTARTLAEEPDCRPAPVAA